MKLKKFLKFWYYSKSYTFARLAKSSIHKIVSHTAKISNEIINISFRTGTEDAHVLYEILFRGKKSDYFSKKLPPEDSIKTILDIGANIGTDPLCQDTCPLSNLSIQTKAGGGK